MAVTKVYFIRHAEAEGNLYRRMHGWYDSLITDNGYRQIAALEKRFHDVRIDAVYSSDLFRTITTAAAIYKPKGLNLNTRSDLREIHVGEWEDKTFAEAARTYPDQFRYFNDNHPLFHCSGSETYADVRNRMAKAVLDIVGENVGKSVAVISHGTAIRNLLAHCLNCPIELTKENIPHGDNTSVSLIEFEENSSRVVYFNDNSHLTDDISTFAHQNWWRGKEEKVDPNLWFRPLDLLSNSQFFLDAREEAWRTIHGSMLHYDGESFLRDAMEQARYDSRSVMQVMLGDQPAGVLHLNIRAEADKGVGSIPFFYLLPEFRCRGMGVQLLGQAISVYRPMGRSRLRLRCAPDNYRAQRFYMKNGFRKVGEDPGSRVPLDVLEKYIGY